MLKYQCSFDSYVFVTLFTRYQGDPYKHSYWGNSQISHLRFWLLYYCMLKKKKLYKVLCGSRASCSKSDKLPQVLPLESALAGAEDHKFENEKIMGVWQKC